MKAYRIDCECDASSIHFAARAKDLKGVRHECDCEYIDHKIRRAPKFDQYAPGPVTISQFLEQGWWDECIDCGVTQALEDGPTIEGELLYCADCWERRVKGLPHDPF